MEEYMASFLAETRELLVQFESDLMALEKTPGDSELTGNLFRILHTIKGAAGMFGFYDIQHLAHEFENLFDAVKRGQVEVDQHLIGDALKVHDLFLSMLDRSASAVDIENFRKHLQEAYPAAKPGNAECVKKAKTAVTSAYCILFIPHPGIYERGLDPEKIVAEISRRDDSLILSHESAHDSSSGSKLCTTAWEIYMKNATRDELDDIFLFYEEEEYRTFELGNPADYEELNSQLQKWNTPGTTIQEHIEKCLSEIKTHGARDIQKPVSSTQNHSNPPAKPTESTLNVSSQKLDELMNLVSELVISTASLGAHSLRLKDSALSAVTENIEKLAKKFRNNALDLRLIPVQSLFNRFRRQVRDLGTSLGKEISLIMEGQETEIDKTVLKAIESPMMHIIRNSIDHGLEFPEERLQKGKPQAGMLKIIAFYSGASVIIQVQDDGRGINLERIRETAILKGYITADQAVTRQELLNMILEPGFTTSENVSLVSGRGVGMDVVRKELMVIGGSLEIETENDLGTSITLKLPTTLSIIDTLMLKVEDMQVLVPLLEVEYCFREKHESICANDSLYMNYKNELVPYISLRNKFNRAENHMRDEMVIIINKNDKKYALLADDIVGEQQAVIKPLGDVFVNQPYFSGGSILVDGNLALVLDTNYLFNQTHVN